MEHNNSKTRQNINIGTYQETILGWKQGKILKNGENKTKWKGMKWNGK